MASTSDFQQVFTQLRTILKKFERHLEVQTDADRTYYLNSKVLGKNKLEEMFWSSPAIAGGNLFLRGTDYLYCIK